MRRRLAVDGQQSARRRLAVSGQRSASEFCISDEDLKVLESKLKLRFKSVNKKMLEFEAMLDTDMAAATLSSGEKHKPPLPVRSDSHPSLKMKAAAKAKSRAHSHTDDKPVITKSDASAKKVVTVSEVCVRSVSTMQLQSWYLCYCHATQEPLASLVIPESYPTCRKLSKEELLTVDSVILTNIEGLFYESRIKPIEPPDIYGVIIDGERHSKPRIFTEVRTHAKF